MKVATKRSSILLIAFLMLIGFQNCSKVRFAAADGNFVGKTSLGDGLEDADFPENEVVNPETEISGHIASCEKFADTLNSENSFSRVIEGIANVVVRKQRGSLLVKDSETLELSNIRGSVLANTSQAKHLRNMRGDLCLVGSSETASLSYLNNHRGHIELIGVHAARTNNTRGTIVINGGFVDVISNHCGNIVLKNGGNYGSVQNRKCGATYYKDPS